VTFQPHERVEVGGGIEVLGKDTISRSGLHTDIVILHYFDPMFLQGAQDGAQLGVVRSADAQEGERLVIFLASHPEAQDPVFPVPLEYVIEDSGQEQRVDDVAFELDVFVGIHWINCSSGPAQVASLPGR